MVKSSKRFSGLRRVSAALWAAVYLGGCAQETPRESAPVSRASESAQRPETVAASYLQQAASRLGVSRPQDFIPAKVHEGGRRSHVRLRQTHRGVPIFGAETIVHLDGRSLAVMGVSDGAVRDVRLDDVEPTVGSNEAAAIARASLPCPRCMTAPPKSALYVLRHKGRDHLTWKVNLTVLDGSPYTSLPVVFVDAKSGLVVWSYDNLQTGTGHSLYSGNVPLMTYARQSDGVFYLEDIAAKAGTFNYNYGTSSKARFTDSDDLWSDAVQRAGVDAQFGAVSALRYFKEVYGRNGIDGNGGPAPMMSIDGVTPLMTSGVHYSSGYSNAFWDGSQMTYGDGDGVQFGPLVSLDIVGHEITHGVTEHTAGLIYQDESGALNESMSDVFGAMIERFVKGQSAATWLIGEECYTPANGNDDALRSLSNPHAASDKGFTSNDDPDHYSERYVGSGDYGGVHINSGIANYAFYLTAMGGTHHLGGSMEGIGPEAAAAVWWLALTSYITPMTNFEQAAVAFYHAAQELYGDSSPEAAAVRQAWGLVGVNPDTDAPSVSISSPSDGTTVMESVDVSISASDNVAVTQVELYVDGALVGSDSTAPFTIPWLTGADGNGTHTLTAKAYDAKSNSRVSAPVVVTVNNETVAPVVAITAPTNGAVVAGVSQVSVAASDNVEVVKVEFKVDGTVIQTLTGAPFVFAWNTSSHANGNHTLSASASDKAGNIGTSSEVVVTVNNPGVAVYDPAYKAPRCATAGSFCDTNALVMGRAALGPEPNTPNTLGGTCADGSSGAFHSDESLDRVRIENPSGSPLSAGATVNVVATAYVYSASSNLLDVFHAADAANPAWTLVATVTPAGSGLRTMTVPLTLAASSTQAVRVQFRYGGSAVPCSSGGYNDRDDVVFAVQGADAEAPSIDIFAPAEGATVTGATTIKANAHDNVGVTEVKFFVDGNELTTLTAAPYEYVWQSSGVSPGLHTIKATGRDAAGNVGESDVTVTVEQPVSRKKALLLVGAVPLSAADEGLRARLSGPMNLDVTVKEGGTSATSDASGRDLVFVSESVTSSSVGGKFASVDAPVINAEPALMDDFGFVTGAYDSVMGTVAGQNGLTIINSSSPLAAGLSGTVNVVSSPSTFVWAVPGGSAEVVARLSGSTTRAGIFAYEKGAAMAAGVAAARRVGFFLHGGTSTTLSASGWSLFDAAVTWCLGSAPPPPVNQAPAADAGPDRTAVAGTVLTLNGQASDDGLPTPPGSLTLSWASVSGPATPQWPYGDSGAASTRVRFDVAGTYVLRFTAHDGALTTSDEVQVVVSPAPPPAQALLVVGAVPASADDAALASRLSSQHGLSVVIKAASATTAEDAAGKALVMISETVTSTSVGTKFSAVTVPVINLEPALQDELGMAGAAWDTQQGNTGGQTIVNIVQSSHPLAAGLTGQPIVVTSASPFAWGQPSSAAAIVATLGGNSSRATVYGYTAGAAMVSGNAPARRVNLFATGTVASKLNSNGWALFDAAVAWVK